MASGAFVSWGETCKQLKPLSDLVELVPCSTIWILMEYEAWPTPQQNPRNKCFLLPTQEMAQNPNMTNWMLLTRAEYKSLSIVKGSKGCSTQEDTRFRKTTVVHLLSMLFLWLVDWKPYFLCISSICSAILRATLVPC